MDARIPPCAAPIGIPRGSATDPAPGTIGGITTEAYDADTTRTDGKGGTPLWLQRLKSLASDDQRVDAWCIARA